MRVTSGFWKSRKFNTLEYAHLNKAMRSSERSSRYNLSSAVRGLRPHFSARVRYKIPMYARKFRREFKC